MDHEVERTDDAPTVSPDRPLTPEGRRRPDAIAGRKVVLADGGEWELPEVNIEFVEAPGRSDGIGYATNIGDAYDAAFMAYEDAQRDSDGLAGTKHSLRMAGELLRRNYDVSVAETNRLIRFQGSRVEQGDPLRRAVMAAALGLDVPKP